MSEFFRNLAVVIGINQYENGISPLATAVNDTKKFNEILRLEHGYQVWILLDEQATLQNITRLLKETLPQKVTADDRLLFYFAGHGIALNGEEGPEGYLIPQDAKLGDTNSYLPMTQLQSALSDLPCRHFLGILDCCFAGAFRWSSTRHIGVVPEVIHQERYDRFITDPAWQVITSAAYDQKALDAFNFQTERGQIGNHSPFAAALIEALAGKADVYPPSTNGQPPGDGVITATELYLYLRDAVEPASEEHRQRQTPGIHPLKKHDKGEYIFLSPGHPLNLPPAPPLDASKNPYRGLESFDEEHSELFFGRIELVERLQNFVKTHALTVVLGASGSGKSSLVKAGLIPQLRQENTEKWSILPPIRPGETPFQALNNALKNAQLPKVATQDPQHNLARSIDVWAKNNPNSKLLLFIDQSEEIITLCQKEDERKEFFQEILTAIDAHRDKLRVVLSLRSDFEPQVRDAGFKFIPKGYSVKNTELKNRWQKGRFIVPAMTRGELRDAIEKPAEARVMYFQPHELVEQLIDEVADMPGALPLLSFALSELYLKYLKRQREAQNRGVTIDRALTQEDYQDLGGVMQSLTQRADEEYEALVNENSAYAQIIRHVMLRMVALGGGELARRRVPLSELEYPLEKNDLVKKVIERFTQARLLVKGEDAEGNPYVEPAHDALVRGWQKLLMWKQEDEEILILQRRLTPAAEDWKGNQQARFLWYDNPRLDLLKKVSKSDDNWLNQVEAEFVRRSVGRKNFNTRRTLGIAIVVILGLGTGLVFSLIGQRDTLIEQAKASQKSAQVNLRLNQSLDGMVESLKAAKALQHPLVQNPLLQLFSSTKRLQELQELQDKIEDTLQWAVYRVKETNRMTGDSSIIVRSIVSPISNNPNEQIIASAGENGKIQLWNLEGKLLKTWKEGSKRVRNVDFSPDKQLLVSSGEDGRVRIWNLEGTQLKKFKAHEGYVRYVSFSSDGKKLATVGGEDGQMFLWDLRGNKLAFGKADGKFAKTVDFHPDKQLIVTIGMDKKVKIWNLEKAKKLDKPELKPEPLPKLEEFPGWGAFFTPDGKYIAAAGNKGHISVWKSQNPLWNSDAQIGVKKWKAHEGRVWNIAFSPDSQQIASGGDDGSVQIWDLKGQQLAKFQGHTGPVRSVRFTADGKHLVSSGDDGTTRLWNLPSQPLYDRHLDSFQDSEGKIDKIILSPNGELLALASSEKDGTIQVRDINNRQPIEERFEKHPVLDVNDLSFSSNGGLLASAGKDGKINVWNLKTKEKLNTFQDHVGSVLKIDFSSNSRRLVSAGEDNTIRIWEDVDEKNKGRYSSIFQLYQQEIPSVRKYSSVEYQITAVIFSPDDRRIISSDNTGYIRFWDLEQNQQTAIWQAHHNAINALDFSSDGDFLATVSKEGTVRWPIESFDELIKRGCNQIGDFLQNNTKNNVDESDRSLCGDVGVPEPKQVASQSSTTPSPDALFLTPQDFRPALQAMAEDYYTRGREQADEKLIANYTQIIEKPHPDNANKTDAYINRGIIHFRQQKYNRAIDDYTEAIAIDADNAEAYLNRGIAYNSLGNYKQALEDYNEVIKRINPNNAEAYLNRGIAYSTQGKHELALKDYNQAIAIDADNADAYYAQGFTQTLIKGKKQEAIENYRKAAALYKQQNQPNYSKNALKKIEALISESP